MKRADLDNTLVCLAAEEREQTGEFLTDILMRWTGAPEKVAYAALERSYDRGLLECGVSVRTSWLTDAGRALLAIQPSRAVSCSRPR